MIHFSFIILTLDEEENLPRLLNSISVLNAATYVLDSGSTDQTLTICNSYNVTIKFHPFENHPKQWDAALKTFEINTPWIIGLDADQVVTSELCRLLQNFRDEDHSGIDGIYFNRKNYFKGRWIKHGGYYPKYLLKMFRRNKGYSDLSENMDHRFQVPGRTIIWKKGHLIEENLKENNISFWIDKHNRYSDLLAQEEVQRSNKLRNQIVKPNLLGSPNERNAWFKKKWWQMPRYLRPFLYFIYRMFFRLGILDGKTGIIYHFLQGFWFRLIVDVKIDEISKPKTSAFPHRFLLIFLSLFCILYNFNIMYIGVTTPGGLYFPLLDKYLNYVKCWQHFCIFSSAKILECLGYIVYTNDTGLSVRNHSGFKLIYSCLGYGIMSCYTAFVIAYPKPIYSKIIFLSFGLAGIQLLNTLRFILISIYYNPYKYLNIDHHDIFNYSLYIIIIFAVYSWLNYNSEKRTIPKNHA